MLGALGLALFVVTYLAGTADRGELMFLDGDSMIVPLFSQSILEGTASNWAMSAVLFVPEIILFLGLSLTGWGIQEVQFLAAVLNFVGLYLVFRAAAVTLAKGNRAALAATTGFVAVCLLALTEGGGDGDSLQLTSLLAMTTYYAATVLGALLTVGITRRIVGNASPQRALAVALFAIVGGSALGYLLRIPLAPWIVADPDNYFQPTRSGESFAYYWFLLIERLSSPAGVFAVVIVVALTVLGAWLTVRFLHRGAVASAVVAASYRHRCRPRVARWPDVCCRASGSSSAGDRAGSVPCLRGGVGERIGRGRRGTVLECAGRQDSRG